MNQNYHGLEVLEGERPFVPPRELYIERKILKEMTDVEYACYVLEHKEALLLLGPSGCGKSTLIRHIAGETNRSYRRVSLNGQATVEDLLGRPVIEKDKTIGFRDGILTSAVRHGWMLVLDEINAIQPEVAFPIHQVTDEKILFLPETEEYVPAHPNFLMVATANPSEDAIYAGTSVLNFATFDRYWVAHIDFLEAEDEMRLLIEKTDADTEIVEKLVRLANELRDAWKAGTMRYLCTTRALLQFCTLTKKVSVGTAAQLTIVNKALRFEQKGVNDIVQLYFGGRSVAP